MGYERCDVCDITLDRLDLMKHVDRLDLGCTCGGSIPGRIDCNSTNFSKEFEEAITKESKKLYSELENSD